VLAWLALQIANEKNEFENNSIYFIFRAKIHF